jgi:chorismate-pyruvate lyase
MSPHAYSLTATMLVLASLGQKTQGAPRSATDGTPEPSAYVTRLEAALLLQTLNAELLSHASATVTLERWCSTHQLASPVHITAERVTDVIKSPTPAQRAELRVAPTDEVRYRRVRLRCGSVVLSEADNWYVPARLTPKMNRVLDTTDTPFGRAVQALHFERRPISSETLIELLPRHWEMRPPAAADETRAPCLPPQVLQQRALLTLPDGTPFSELVETYTSNVLAVPRLEPLPRCAGN